MTEEEWLAAIDPHPMLGFLGRTGRERKLRLFAVAACRRIWEHMDYAPGEGDSLRNSVLVTERYADGQATAAELEVAFRSALFLWNVYCDSVGGGRVESLAVLRTAIINDRYEFDPADVSDAVIESEAGWCIIRDPRSYPELRVHVNTQPSVIAARQAHADLVRDVIGNPFRPAPDPSAWLTSTVVALARQMYESRDFSAMPILADALQDAGCDNDDMLKHCRSDGPHARGGWVVDLLLGKV